MTIGEEKEVYVLKKYGKLFDVTWETLVNDDLDAMLRIPAMMGAAARRLENLTAYLPIIGAADGETMGDGTVLFHADHNNLLTSTGVPDTASLNAAMLAMRNQTGVTAGVKINVEPKFLLCSPSLEGTVKQLLRSTADPTVAAGQHSGIANIWQGALEPIIEPNLTTDAAYPGAISADWYMIADNGQIDTLEVCFLEGNETPFLEQMDYSTIDGRRWKVRHVVAAKAIDWRGMIKNQDGA